MKEKESALWIGREHGVANIIGTLLAPFESGEEKGKKLNIDRWMDEWMDDFRLVGFDEYSVCSSCSMLTHLATLNMIQMNELTNIYGFS